MTDDPKLNQELLARHGTVFGVAVSGGSDSLALLHLLQAQGYSLRAATVDHGLRDGSAAEAAQVAGICAQLGIPHDTLHWRGWDGSGNLQDRARRARYGLLADWARDRGLPAVALGHTRDDQAETFLMRLSRAAGVDGLAAMAAEFRRDGAMFLRPLLDVPRADLQAYLAGRGIAWIDDPSNVDAGFDRVRARQALAALQPLGITAGTLAAVARHMTAARQVLDRRIADIARHCVDFDTGEVVIDRAGLAGLLAEEARRLLSGILRYVAGSEYAPRAEPLAQLRAAIADGKPATLNGCLIVTDSAQVRVFREFNAVADLRCATDRLWDNRWRLQGPHAPDLRIGALGEAGLADCPDWRATGRSRAALAASPAIWRENRLIAAPIAGFSNGWRANCRQSRDELINSLISH